MQILFLKKKNLPERRR